jgi:hypothetical protein
MFVTRLTNIIFKYILLKKLNLMATKQKETKVEQVCLNINELIKVTKHQKSTLVQVQTDYAILINANKAEIVLQIKKLLGYLPHRKIFIEFLKHQGFPGIENTNDNILAQYITAKLAVEFQPYECLCSLPNPDKLTDSDRAYIQKRIEEICKMVGLKIDSYKEVSLYHKRRGLKITITQGIVHT